MHVMLKALFFDVDGTLAETEEGHRHAWNVAFAAHGLGWTWGQPLYRDLLQIAGGRERLSHYAAGRLSAGEIATIHADKDRRYQTAVARGEVALRPGVEALIADARRCGLQLGIVTTSGRVNVETLLRATLGASAPGWFSVWATAEDASAKKPDPAVYHVALERSGLTPDTVLAIEDSRNGLLAAHRAGIPVLLTPSFYMSGEACNEAAQVWPDLSGITITTLSKVFQNHGLQRGGPV